MSDERLASDVRAECEADVVRPGKFEGEAVYVPYFWSAYLNGFHDEDHGDVLSFEVTATDREIFPELEGVERVYLRERSDGFVVQVTKDDASDEDVVDLDSMDAGEIIDHQGWNDESLRGLFETFIASKGLNDEWATFIRKQANEENEG